ncbi:MAG: substrate-binding domain-containing protein [Brevinematales bacterium]|nr:substrate-binding domain-containing protein [Brevinematales bacterium]
MKKRIAIFISTLHDEYQRILVKNFLKATESLDIQLSFFNGYSLLSPYGYQYVNNSIFSLVNTNNTDGIILTSTIFPFIKKSDVKEFLAKINKKNIPIVLFSYQIENYQCIITNPKKAIINAIEHLIYKHNAKKIAFIKGPENSEEANERFEAYIEGLKKNNIEFDSSLIIKGNFNKVDGYNGVEELIKKRKIFPDAIIASNDPMCIGALEYLKENNIKVPEEIKLIGFDDILETKTTIPAITTIKQPLEKMTRIAVELFLNKSENNIISVDSELVIRESCGCYNFKKPEPIVFNNKNITNLFTTIEKNSEEPIKKILEKIRLKIENNKFENSEDIKKIISLNSDNIEPTLNLLFKIKESLSLFITEMELLKNFEKLISEIIFYLYELKERFLLQELYKLFWNQSNFEYASQFITVSFNTQKLIENLKNTLNATRIKNFLLCLYNGKVKYKNKFDWIFPKTLKIILCYKDGRPIDKLENKNIKTSEIMPKDFLSNQNSSIFMPIYYENECLGYMIAAPIPDDTVSLTILRREISMVIKGTLLIERQLKTKEKLRKTLIKLQESKIFYFVCIMEK